MDKNLMDRILYHRQRQGLSCTRLAEILGVKRARVQAWETGRNEPSINMLRRLSKVLAVPVDSLLSPVPPDGKIDTGMYLDIGDLNDDQRKVIFAAVSSFRQPVLF